MNNINWDKVGNIAYKILCGLMIIFFALGALGMFMNHRFIKGLIGIIVIAILVLKLRQQASIQNLFIVVVTLLVGMYGVGLVD